MLLMSGNDSESTERELHRVNQLTIVELFVNAKPEDSRQELEELKILNEDIFSSRARIGV